MNIFGHLLPDSAILGIGDLMLEYNPNTTDFQLFGRQRYSFNLHLTAHTTAIKSDWFNINENQEEKDKMKAWNDRYQSTREQVARMIGETTDRYELHLEDVEKLYSNTVSTFESLMKDMTPVFPVPDISKSIELRTQRVFDNLLDLKNLAIK